jgi:uncharacterized membrane protein
MPKRVFWPVALLIFGLIILAANLGLLPAFLVDLWPVMLIIVGLGGLLISDREEWTPSEKSAKSSPKKPVAKNRSGKKSR